MILAQLIACGCRDYADVRAWGGGAARVSISSDDEFAGDMDVDGVSAEDLDSGGWVDGARLTEEEYGLYASWSLRVCGEVAASLGDCAIEWLCVWAGVDEDGVQFLFLDMDDAGNVSADDVEVARTSDVAGTVAGQLDLTTVASTCHASSVPSAAVEASFALDPDVYAEWRDYRCK